MKTLITITFLAFVSVYSVCGQPLTGEKTVGTDGDYTSLADAISELNANGVGSGGVTFLVNAGESFLNTIPVITATGTESNPVIIRNSEVPGTNNPKISLEGNGDLDYAVEINGGSYFTFNGIDIQCSVASDNGLEMGYYLHNGASNNIIKNCTINLNKNNENQATGIFVYAGCDYNLFYNNLITDCKQGYHFFGGTGLSFGNEIGTENSGVSEVSDIYGGGIGVIHQSGMKIFNTTIKNVFNDATTAEGIAIGSGGPYFVYDNDISDITSTSTVANPQGISVTADSASIYNNKIHNIWSESVWGSAIGIISSGGAINIYNNMVYNILSPESDQPTGVKGIYVSNGGDVKVYFNTVFLDYESTNPDNNSAVLYCADFSGSLDFRNNILFNSVDVSIGERAVVFWKSTSDLGNIAMETDHNCLYVPEPSAKNLIFYDGVNSDIGISAYKTRLSPREQNSISVFPPFINQYPPYNLHIPPSASTSLKNGGIAIEGFDFDIDYETRSDPPDIGADEFTPATIINEGIDKNEFTVIAYQNTIIVKPRSNLFTGKISVFNLLGQTIDNKEYNEQSSVMYRYEANKSGIYFISVETKSKIYTRKVYLK
jgi:hypothetical protein